MKNYWLPDNKKPAILIAPNAFKGTLKAQEFCRILEEEFYDLPIQIHSFPLCDGGDGSAEIIASYFQASPVTVSVRDALGRPHQTVYYATSDTAILDLAAICGIKGLKIQEYDVMNANTAGLGMVLSEITGRGFRNILLGLGGSASIDGGCGALERMGMKIVNRNCFQNKIVDITKIDITELKKNFKSINLTLLCDVEHPLCGESGAAKTFGPQKGASPAQTERLDRELLHYAKLIYAASGKDIINLKHGGAAGGIAGAFAALLDAQLVSGAQYCLQLSQFENYLPSAKLIITGEGKLDDQSLGGKLSGVLATLAGHYQIPILAITGSSDISLSPFQKIYQLIDYASNLPDAMRQPGYYLRKIARVIRQELLNLI